jgi:hypothetical protein
MMEPEEKALPAPIAADDPFVCEFYLPDEEPAGA